MSLPKTTENHLQIASQHVARHRAIRGYKQQFLYQVVMGGKMPICQYETKKRMGGLRRYATIKSQAEHLPKEDRAFV